MATEHTKIEKKIGANLSSTVVSYVESAESDICCDSNKNINDLNAIMDTKLPKIIISEFDSSAPELNKSESVWYNASDESFVREENKCEKQNVLSPIDKDDSGNGTATLNTELSAIKDLSSCSLSPPSVSSLAMKPENKDMTLMSGIGYLSRADRTYEIIEVSDDGDAQETDEDESTELNDIDNLDTTLDRVNYIIDKGKRLVKKNVIKFNGRLTLSPTRIQKLQEMAKQVE